MGEGFQKIHKQNILKSIKKNNQESRKKWMEMIFQYHAKYNRRSGDLQFWTHENHAIELYKPAMIESRMNYIHENPVRAGLLEEEDYLYSSARNYKRIDRGGLLVAQLQIEKDIWVGQDLKK